MRDGNTSSANHTFGRDSRLLKPAEFQRVFSAARRSSDRYFTVLYRESEGTAPRLGFAVAKKKIPTAVGRNRLRRIARESFRTQKRTLGGIDIIILAQNAAGAASSHALRASLRKHWQNLQQRQDQTRQPRRQKARPASDRSDNDRSKKDNS
ncbi:MAG: ribonuclease P protein component [Gammaproteobacteria bacterium]|nr:ribonuclease P protein component [Gammaproteobacteria bacterium]NND54335.1 ribonuclease P protein component [Gammaproteobacteria bacterium]